MSRVKDGCPKCKAEVYVLDNDKEEESRQVVCPACYTPFIVVNRKTGLPGGEPFEIDIKEII